MAADRNTGKFPYIVLPSLSSEDNPRPTRPDHPVPKTPKPRNVAIKAVSIPNVPNIHLPPVNVQQPEPLSPRSMTSSKALTRHITLSKQFAAAKQASSVQEVQAAQRKILMAHYEMRKSPRSLYPSDSEVGCPEPKDSSDLERQSRKLSLEALAQLFPHRIQRTHSSRPKKNANSNEEIREMPTTVQQITKTVPNTSTEGTKIPGSKITYDFVKPQDIKALQEQLKIRIDGLTVHVTKRDEEISQLKQDLIDLQLLVLKDKKESERQKVMTESLTREIAGLDRKLRALEKTVETQEKNILDKLLLLDGMDDSDSDLDISKVDYKPSAWVSSSSSQTQIQPSPQTPESKSSDTSLGTLKECMNWVPVAPDFDKLLQIIALLNFRMDKNQSMKICRTGNATSFKHADTINLSLYKNGLILGKSGFRSYATLSVIKLINEMFSGYFPSELHSQYPDGVVFVVSDKRSVPHDLNPGFFGPGMKLCESKSAPILLPGLEKLSNFMKPRETKKPAEPTISCTSVSSSLSPVSSSTSFCTLPELSTPPVDLEHKMIELKLKNTATGKSCKMRVSTSSTVQEVLNHVEKFAADDDTDAHSTNSDDKKTFGKFDLVLPVPHGILTSGNATLKEYGFVQNTLLYLKPCEQ